MVDPIKIRTDFPIFENFHRKTGKELIYLDSAASSQTPRQVVEAMDAYYFNYRSNIHRSPHVLSVEATDAYEKARDTVAGFIRAESKGTIFTASATIGANMAVLMLEEHLKLNSNHNVVVSAAEHHSNFIPLQELAKRTGAAFKVIPIRETELNYEAAESLINKETKIVAISLVSNVLGTVYDVERIIRHAKACGAITIVDATAAAGHIQIDVRALACDFLFFSGHKLLGPTGIGVLYGRQELLSQLRPVFFGGGIVDSVTEQDTVYREIPALFEPGTPNIAGAIGLARAIEYIEMLGMDNIVQHIQRLVAHADTELRALPFVDVVSESDVAKNAGIVSFVVKGTGSHIVAESLGKENISSRGGYHCAMPLMKALGVWGVCRASFYIYNDLADIKKLLSEVKQNKFTPYHIAVKNELLK